MRQVAELRGLTWANIDLQAGWIKVRQRADRYNRLGPPKSKAGRREIPMAPIVANTLREWKLTCPSTSLDLVFPSERREVLWHTNLYA
jgi:integrase